jgi:hypothetical protein
LKNNLILEEEEPSGMNLAQVIAIYWYNYIDTFYKFIKRARQTYRKNQKSGDDVDLHMF